MRTWYIITPVILCLVMIPVAQANAVFWDLLITPTISNDPVPLGGYPELSGIIKDHGGNAVIGANVSVRTLGYTAWLETNEHGKFAYSFNETVATSGLHSVLIHATADGLGGEKTGFADITYRTEGGSGLSAEAKILATEDAKKYLNADKDDFTNDLVGSLLYEYYDDLYQTYLEQIERKQKLEDQNNQLLINRELALNTTNNLVDDDEKRTGHISKYSYEKLISNTDPTIRNDVIRQINYTMTAFQEAQDTIKLIQESGKSYEEAVNMYSENNPLSRETMDLILTGYSYDDIENMKTEDASENMSVINSNSTTLNVPTNDLNSSVANQTVINQTVAENIVIPEPTYNLYISATALNWDLPPSGTSINLTGSAIGLSSSGKIMVGINGTLIELQLHELKITK